MKYKLLPLLFGLTTGTVSNLSADNYKKLTEMDLSKAYQQYGGTCLNQSVTGEPAVIGGVHCSNVVGVHSKSLIKIDLKGNGITFNAGIGIADSHIDYKSSAITSIPLADGKRMFYQLDQKKKNFVGVEGKNGSVDKGVVTYKILGDKKLLYTRTMKSGEPMQNLSLNLQNTQILELIVEDGGDGPSGDFALWVNPTFKYSEIPPAAINTDVTVKVNEMDKKIWSHLKGKLQKLEIQKFPIERPNYDWLIKAEKAIAVVKATPDEKGLVLTNGLVARTFRITPNLATTDLINLMTGENMLRAVSSEGTVKIDGVNYSIGGLDGQPERGYILPEWIDQLTTIPNSFIVEDFDIKPLKEKMKWARKRWALEKKTPTGQTLTFTLRGQNALASIVIKIHFDLYDHLPTLCKRMEVINEGTMPIKLDEFKLEQLAFAEPESPVGGNPSQFRLPNISIESDYVFGGFDEKESEHTEKWITDPDYTSQCNYPLNTPCILEVSPPIGPDALVTNKSSFESMSVYETPYDSDDRERKGLFKRRFYRYTSPWLTENPIFMHVTSIEPDVVKRAIDQCAEVGYEMIILSFGSGVDMESTDPKHVELLKSFADYAHSKGIELGGYSLLSSRWISDDIDVINPETGKRGGMIFGSSPCLCSEWGNDYFNKIQTFCEKTGFSVFEHDGSYPGNVCASTTHKYHNGLKDSQWKQWQKITELYRWMCEKGIYINVPDYYFLNGSNKTGIGYREVNWSLPRDRQLIHGRQVNFAGTFDRLASSCWTFVPLVQYHGGGEAATIEPLKDHLKEYRAHMIQNYGAGIQACYRGPRLYDTDETKATVKEVIDWYKKYRIILNSDIIHLRKADGRDWDGILHVNPLGKEKGLALFFNPTNKEIVRTLNIPLYYTGLAKKVEVRQEEQKKNLTYQLNRDYSIQLTITIPANGYTWYVFE